MRRSSYTGISEGSYIAGRGITPLRRILVIEDVICVRVRGVRPPLIFSNLCLQRGRLDLSVSLYSGWLGSETAMACRSLPHCAGKRGGIIVGRLLLRLRA